MADGKRKTATYTPEQKQQALALLRVHTTKEVAEMLGIPRTTVKTWEDRLKKAAERVDLADEEPVEAIVERDEGDEASAMVFDQNASTSAGAPVGVDNAKFVEGTSRLALKSLEALNARIEMACDDLKAIGELKRFILENKESVLSGLDREIYPEGAVLALFRKLDDIEIIRVKDLATVLGVAYDKYALASGKPTGRVEVGFEDYAE